MISTPPTRVYFISDCHLGATYLDRQTHEALLVRFLDSIAGSATELYLLGDILDYWYEYRTVVPRGYVRFFGALARLADAGVKITWLTGNHDIWMFDYLRDELGITVIDGTLTVDICGRHFYMAHGDRLGNEPVNFKFIQHLFRNKFCQKLFASVHPRWTVPLGYGWSRKNRGATPQLSHLSETNRSGLIDWCKNLLGQHPDLDYVLLGHYHVNADINIDGRCRLLILGDWIHRSTYAVFDGNDLKLLQYEDKSPELSFINC